jgi:hypothetical protein
LRHARNALRKGKGSFNSFIDLISIPRKSHERWARGARRRQWVQRRGGIGGACGRIKKTTTSA